METITAIRVPFVLSVLSIIGCVIELGICLVVSVVMDMMESILIVTVILGLANLNIMTERNAWQVNMNKLEKVTKEVDLLVDGLGKDIDEKIKPTVIAFRLWGLPTFMSCEGHMDRALPYPWIDVYDNDKIVNEGCLGLMKDLLDLFYLNSDRDMCSLQIVPFENSDGFRVQSCSKLGSKEDTIDCVRDGVMLNHLQKEMSNFADFLIGLYGEM
jgi:hypothetical protein